MPSLIDFSESECITYIIGRELSQLERLASGDHTFKDAELADLHRCLARMNQIVGALSSDTGQGSLPDWLQRKAKPSPDETDEAQSA